MKILIVANEVKFVTPFIKYLESCSDTVIFLNKFDNNYNYKELDVIYIAEPVGFAYQLINKAHKYLVPIVSEFFGVESKCERKKHYRNIYKQCNAIHYRDKSDQEELEGLVKRRTNGHIFSTDNYIILRKMLFTYANPVNHTSYPKFYYSDEINDDFAFHKIKVDKKAKPFKYLHNGLVWFFFEVLLYYVIAKPMAFLLNKIVYHQRIRNKQVLKRFKHKGYFIYSNHTNGMADAYTPNLLTRKKNFMITGRETVSLPGLKGIVTMMGAIPIYKDMNELPAYNECIKARINQKHSITIYPEAHIWPFYTKIRPFKKDSFRYPVELNTPVYVVTNTWQKRRFRNKAKLISYVSGPLFVNEELSRSEAMEDLRDRVYFEMIKVTRSVKQFETIRYIKVDK